MSEDKITWGKFETRSVVRPATPLELNYAPEIAQELENYTMGKFETRSIVRPKIYLKMHRVRPYLKMTIGLNDEAKLTYAQAMEFAAKSVKAIIDLAPQLRLEYSEVDSKVVDGKLIAVLLTEHLDDTTERKLNDFIEAFRSRECAEQNGATNSSQVELAYLTIA